MNYTDITLITFCALFFIKNLWPKKNDYAIKTFWFPYKDDNGKVRYDKVDAVIYQGEKCPFSSDNDNP